MRILIPIECALSICVALLAGCNSAATVTPTQGLGLAPNVTRAVRTVARGFAELHRHKNSENLTSTSGSHGGSGCTITISASGNVAGTYPGTFTGNVLFSACEHHPGFWGSFVITSGANKITGWFAGAAQGTCGRGGCGDGGNLTYKATLEPGGKTFSGKGSGRLGLGPQKGNVYMDLTLLSL